MTTSVTLTLSVQPQTWSTMDGVASQPAKGGLLSQMEWKGASEGPRLPECRELLAPSRSRTRPTPSLWLHEPGCTCKDGAFNGQQQQEDEALALRIAAASEAYRSGQKLAALVTTQQKKSRLRYSAVISVSWLFSSPPTRSPANIEELCMACSSLDIEKVTRCLSEDEMAINLNNHSGTTPLLAAVRAPEAYHRPRSHLALITFLLNCGADPNAIITNSGPGTYPTSVLAAACALGLLDVVRLLLDRGAAADAPLPSVTSKTGSRARNSSMTALHVASLAGRAACVDLLVGHGNANVNAAFDVSRTTQYFGPAVRRRLAAPIRDVTALHLAHGSDLCTAVLLAHDADPSARDSNGRTPLHWAVHAGNTGVVARLLRAGTDADAVDREGATPLALLVEQIERGAAGGTGPEVMGMLMEHCADADRRGPGSRGMSLRHRVLMVEQWRRVYRPVLEGC